MGIWARLRTLMKSNVNDLITKSEDPEKILNQLVLDMRDQIISAKKHVAVAIADEKKLKKQLEKAVRNTKEWERKAMMAVQGGRDDLAMEALQKKEQQGKLAQEYQTQWEMQKKASEKLKTSLRTLNKKIDEAKRKKELLIARKKRVEAQQKIQQTMGGIGDVSAFDAFDQMSSRIDQMEAEAEAEEELNREELGLDINDKFAELEADVGANDALAALKAKMGVRPPARQQQQEEEFSFEQMEAELAALDD